MSAPDDLAWAAFVRPRARAVTDLPEWRDVLQAVDGVRSHRLVHRRGGAIAASLEVFEIRHALFGHYLCSAAFGTDGGLFAADDEARRAVVDAGASLARELGVDYLCIRGRGTIGAGFRTDARYATAVVDLGASDEFPLEALPSKTRNQVRRGLREGFTVEHGAGQLDAFHDVLTRHMRDLGSPCHGRDFYREVAARFAGQAEFFVVREGSTVVAGALLFLVNDTASNYHTVALREYNRRCANYLLYWSMMQHAKRHGCRWFDLGRSLHDSTQLEFKRNWAPRVVPLSYDYLLVRATRPPALDPRSPRFRVAARAWQQLPLALTRRLGPIVIRGLA